MMSDEILLGLIPGCWILAALCNAIADVLAFKFKTSIFKNLNPDWWNPGKSWRNKYKNKAIFQGEAFFGSTTFLRFTTDAWHMFQFLSNSFLTLSLVFTVHRLNSLEWWEDVVFFIALKILWGVVFQPCYKIFFRTKKK